MRNLPATSSSPTTSQVLRQAFRSGQPISCLLKGERPIVRRSSRYSASQAIPSGLRRDSCGQRASCATGRGRNLKAGGVRVRGLKEDGVGAVGNERGGKIQDKETPLIGSMADLFNLEKQFAFYGAYHSNKLNVLIHMVFVWPILFTIQILWAYTLPFFPLSLPAGTLPLQQYMVLNFNLLVSVFYGLYYVALDKKAGSLGAAMCVCCWLGSQAVAQTLTWGIAWKVVLLAQIICWTFQFIGHGVFEGRAPALLDNLPQAFLMAPFFVLLEFLQSVFGYEPYPGFQKSVEAKAQESIDQWKSSKGKKAT